METSALRRAYLFDYKALRLLVGLIAFSIPFVTNLLSPDPPGISSISASYYTPARDAFVGLSFAIAALFWAYNGHREFPAQKYVSKVAALATVVVAVFPTSGSDGTSATSVPHYVAAGIVFAILAWFCFVAFRHKTKQRQGIGKARRDRIYLVCGWAIALFMLVVVVGQLAPEGSTLDSLRLTYWGETGALFAFGIAWMVAAKFSLIKPLLDEDDDTLRLLPEKAAPLK